MNRQTISIVFLFLFAAAVPLWADVTFTLENAGDQVVRVNAAIDGGSVVRGLALKVTLTDAAFVDLEHIMNVNPVLNAYIDFYAENEGYLDEMGGDETKLPGSIAGGLSADAHPVADPDGPGVIPSLPATVFIISLGALDNNGGGLGLDASGVICEFQLSDTTGSTAGVCIEPDPIRGGVVGDNLGIVDAEACLLMDLDCLNDNLGNYLEWEQFSKPDCWCYERQCQGDADGKPQGTTITGFAYVSTNDLGVLVACWQIKEPPKGPGIDGQFYDGIPLICGDFNHDPQGTTITGFARCSTDDLARLVQNWQVKESPKGPGVPKCELAPVGEINYYKYPD